MKRLFRYGTEWMIDDSATWPAGHRFEWADIKQDLKALQSVMIEENDKRLALRTECKGVCGKVFQAVGVAIPPTIKEL